MTSCVTTVAGFQTSTFYSEFLNQKELDDANCDISMENNIFADEITRRCNTVIGTSYFSDKFLQCSAN